MSVCLPILDFFLHEEEVGELIEKEDKRARSGKKCHPKLFGGGDMVAVCASKTFSYTFNEKGKSWWRYMHTNGHKKKLHRETCFAGVSVDWRARSYATVILNMFLKMINWTDSCIWIIFTSSHVTKRTCTFSPCFMLMSSFLRFIFNSLPLRHNQNYAWGWCHKWAVIMSVIMT